LVAALDEAALVADFLAGALAGVVAWVVVVLLRAVEDTNTSREGHMGAAEPGMVKSRSGHSATEAGAITKREGPPARADEGPARQAETCRALAAAFFSCL
jgi:hypothetical protein